MEDVFKVEDDDDDDAWATKILVTHVEQNVQYGTAESLQCVVLLCSDTERALVKSGYRETSYAHNLYQQPFFLRSPIGSFHIRLIILMCVN